jgi:signal transduction histidine kinase
VGSLFTRSFLFFWATIVIFIAVTVLIATANFLADSVEPQRLAREAQPVLDAGGRPALEAWLRTRNVGAGPGSPRVLVIDPLGRDILGRALPPYARGEGFGPPHHRPPMEPPGPPPMDAGDSPTSLGPPGVPSRDPEAGPPVRPLPDVPLLPRLKAADGTVFVLALDPPPSRGPFSPPFSRPALVLLLAIALTVSGLVSYGFARSITRPLERLAASARRLADGDLSTRAVARDASRRDEIGGLAREFDAMASRLAALIEARKQLLRDMSHELRSPLARLQMAVGIARQPGADAERQLERIERESERLEALIARILDFARLERDPSTLAREEVDLAELVRRVVHDAEFESQSPSGRIELAIAAEADAGWARIPHADPAVLHTAVDNVVRNALLHGGDGPIIVSVSADAGSVTIEVRDHGPGVPPRDLERIFEPFYRVATDGPRIEGHGVGLALAQRAAALHGGRIVAANVDGGGLRVSIVLPYLRPHPTDT